MRAQPPLLRAALRAAHVPAPRRLAPPHATPQACGAWLGALALRHRLLQQRASHNPDACGAAAAAQVRGKDGVGAKMDSMDLEREKGITIKARL